MKRDERNKNSVIRPGAGHAVCRYFCPVSEKNVDFLTVSDDRWSIHEIILHLADSEASAYVRCRTFIAEPGGKRWSSMLLAGAGSLGYFHQSTREALKIIRRLRKMTHQLLVALPDQVWEHTAAHPRDGEISLEDWIEIQERHIPHHIDQRRFNYQGVV